MIVPSSQQNNSLCIRVGLQQIHFLNIKMKITLQQEMMGQQNTYMANKKQMVNWKFYWNYPYVLGIQQTDVKKSLFYWNDPYNGYERQTLASLQEHCNAETCIPRYLKHSKLVWLLFRLTHEPCKQDTLYWYTVYLGVIFDSNYSRCRI